VRFEITPIVCFECFTFISNLWKCVLAAGRKLVPKLAALADANDQEFFSALSGGEDAALLAALKKLASAHDLRKIPVQ
jgi:hypothetical protein